MRISSGGTVQSTNMLFSAHEDTGRTNPDIAAFTIKTYRDESERALQPGAPISLHASRAALPLSPGRAKARDVNASAEILWRVRAVDGMGHAASWSEYRRYGAGPDMTL
jgi:hypothetical protein